MQIALISTYNSIQSQINYDQNKRLVIKISLKKLFNIFQLSLLARGKVPSCRDLRRTVFAIMQSTAFLTTNAVSYGIFTCLIRNYWGSLNFYTVSISLEDSLSDDFFLFLCFLSFFFSCFSYSFLDLICTIVFIIVVCNYLRAPIETWTVMLICYERCH